MNWIFVLLLTEIILFLTAFEISGKDIMAPSVVMCIMFVISTTAALTMRTLWNISYGFESYLIIVAGLVTFIFSESVFRTVFLGLRKKSIDSEVLDKNRSLTISTAWVYFFIIFDVAVLVWYALQIRRITGMNGLDMFGYYRSRVAHLVDRSRADIQLTNTLTNQLCKIVIAAGYVSAFVAIRNKIYSKIKYRKQKKLLLMSFMIIVIYQMGASRGEILRFLTAILIYYYILLNEYYGWNRNLSSKFVRIGIIAIVAGIPAFYYSLSLLGRSTTAGLMSYAATYLGGGIQLFDTYVKNPTPTIAFGEESLVGVHQFLSILGFKADLRDPNLEFRTLGNGMYSNVYTFFRRPLHDFGFTGMLIFTLLVALLFSWIYYSKIRGNRGTSKVDVWILVYGYMYFWIVVSSIDQLSQTMLRVYSLTIILAIVVVYKLLTKIKITV